MGICKDRHLPDTPRAVFGKIASDPVPVPQEALSRVHDLLESGRLFRYGEDTAEASDVTLLERDFAQWTGRRYANAVNSCGCALFLALRALGVSHGDKVLCNAFTLAPVPGAILHAGGRPVFVETGRDLTVDLDHLEDQIARCGARVFLLSHMRGHCTDLARVREICDRHDVRLLEDCAHTLGAEWDGRQVGSFGDVACYSSQSFKHLNSGEGGLLVTDDKEIAVKVTLMSGSYMLYGQNGARPELEDFEALRDQMPNFSMRMSNLAAALLRPQLDCLPEWKTVWRRSYQLLEDGLRDIPGVEIIERPAEEDFVASSIQFHICGLAAPEIETFVADAGAHGVFLKWFGAPRTTGFTSRVDQWGYAPAAEPLPMTAAAMAGLMDMRIPLSLQPEDCSCITQVLRQSMAVLRPTAGA